MKQFKPALLFLAKFLGIYILGNIIYGVFVESYGSRVDDITYLVTCQTTYVLQILGYDASCVRNAMDPTVAIISDNHSIVNVYEGCNGINVMIVFMSFMVAFGGTVKRLMWFIPFGILIIHLCNLARISLLYNTAIHSPSYFYYFHKYFFTAILYLAVFGLWALWVLKFYDKHQTNKVS